MSKKFNFKLRKSAYLRKYWIAKILAGNVE